MGDGRDNSGMVPTNAGLAGWTSPAVSGLRFCRWALTAIAGTSPWERMEPTALASCCDTQAFVAFFFITRMAFMAAIAFMAFMAFFFFMTRMAFIAGAASAAFFAFIAFMAFFFFMTRMAFMAGAAAAAFIARRIAAFFFPM